MPILTAADLHDRAAAALREAGLEPDFPPDALREAEHPAHEHFEPSADLRELLWSSIDSPGARDLDQIEFVEELKESDGGAAFRVRIGIADVDESVPAGSSLDRFAAQRGTSVYTGLEAFPMLPEALSAGRTSLLPNQDRHAIVVDLRVRANGETFGANIYRAAVRNRARLGYEECGEWLLALNQGKATEPPDEIRRVPGLTRQIMLQWYAAKALRISARKRGALEIETTAATAVVNPKGHIANLVLRRRSLARTIIETFMLAVNTTITDFLHQHGMASIERVVRLPERWERIATIARERGFSLPDTPDAEALADFLEREAANDSDHFPRLSQIVAKLIGSGRYEMVAPTRNMVDYFGPAVNGYTHSTAPNRRYADLVVQRQVKAALSGAAPPYSEAQLAAIAEHCNEQAAAARKVERLVRKVAAAEMLSSALGDEFEAVVTGVRPTGEVFARLVRPPVEGRIVEGDTSRLDIGDDLRVRLIHVDPARGWIDFAVA